jgi:hypothetical protein
MYAMGSICGVIMFAGRGKSIYRITSIPEARLATQREVEGLTCINCGRSNNQPSILPCWCMLRKTRVFNAGENLSASTCGCVEVAL